jgi:hypothetical protein
VTRPNLWNTWSWATGLKLLGICFTSTRAKEMRWKNILPDFSITKWKDTLNKAGKKELLTLPHSPYSKEPSANRGALHFGESERLQLHYQALTQWNPIPGKVPWCLPARPTLRTELLLMHWAMRLLPSPFSKTQAEQYGLGHKSYHRTLFHRSSTEEQLEVTYANQNLQSLW